MRQIDKITRIVIIVAVAMLVLSMFCRCTTTRYVPITEYKDRVVVNTDSFLKTDSVYVHDSVSVYIKGDTVFKDKYHLQYKDRYIVKNKSDTLVVRDSVRCKVEVEKQLSKADKFFLGFGRWVLTFLIAVAIALVGRFVLKKHS